MPVTLPKPKRRPVVPTKYDLAVVGGAGHVGAPLAIVLAKYGFRTLVHDLNEPAMKRLAEGKLPFLEEGGEKLLRSVLAKKMLGFSSSPTSLEGIPIVIVTIGTPIDEFHNPITSSLTRCVDTLLPHIEDGTCLILRSTVAPGTTQFLHGYLKARKRRVSLAFCPERVVQGKAINEIQQLSQIVSGMDARALKEAKRVFGRIAPEIIVATPLEAEYAKLICNAYRYIQFAATNQLYMMVEGAGVDYVKLLSKMKQGYPRMGGIPGPGFAAGPCLMKDTMQLFAHHQYNFILGQVAVTINEGLPNYIMSRLQARHDLAGKTVGILGMAFKADSDDIRDSLSYKLRKCLTFAGVNVLCSDEFVKDPSFVPKEELLDRADFVVVGVPHSAYRKLTLRRSVPRVDLWGILAG